MWNVGNHVEVGCRVARRGWDVGLARRVGCVWLGHPASRGQKTETRPETRNHKTAKARKQKPDGKPKPDHLKAGRNQKPDSTTPRQRKPRNHETTTPQNHKTSKAETRWKARNPTTRKQSEIRNLTAQHLDTTKPRNHETTKPQHPVWRGAPVWRGVPV